MLFGKTLTIPSSYRGLLPNRFGHDIHNRPPLPPPAGEGPKVPLLIIAHTQQRETAAAGPC